MDERVSQSRLWIRISGRLDDDPLTHKAAFTELFKQFEAPSAYVPSQFVAAMKKVESTVR